MPPPPPKENNVTQLLRNSPSSFFSSSSIKKYIYIYIHMLYIYIYAVESKICPKIALFWVNNLSKCSFVCPFSASKILFFLQGEWDFQKKQNYHFWVKNLSNYIAQPTWTDFWLNIFTFLALFPSFKICWNHYLYRAFRKDSIFCSPPPPKH